MTKIKKYLFFLIGISLIILYSSQIFALEESTESFFDVGGIRCELTSSTASWVNSTSGLTINAMNNCRVYAIAGIVDPCCPSGLYCNSTGSCVNSSDKHFCSDYTSRDECREDSLNLAINSLPNSSVCETTETYKSGSKQCVNVTECGCKWKNSECVLFFNSTVNCVDGSSSNRGYCEWSFGNYQFNCNTSLNNIIYTATAVWQGSNSNSIERAACTDIREEYPCVSSAKLGFFNFTNLIITILAIFLIYYFYITTHKTIKKR